MRFLMCSPWPQISFLAENEVLLRWQLPEV